MLIPMLSIPDLADDEQQSLAELMNVLEEKTVRNDLLAEYYDSKFRFKDFMIAIPPSVRDKIDSVLDWPSKAVDLLSQRIVIDGFENPEASTADLGLDEVWALNRLDVEAPQAHDSALIHSCAFVWTTLGDVISGEARVVVNTVSARNGSAVWNPRTRRLMSALQVVERDIEGGSPSLMVMGLPDRVVTMERRPGGGWTVDRRRHSLGRVPVEPLVYRPFLDRPFGRSRISRPIMSHTDSALRTVIRSEIGGEFFAAPRLAALNMPKGAFANGGWDAVMSRALVIDAPDANDTDADPAWQPAVQQLQQISMQPHNEQLRMFATLFASAASIPLDAVGIVQDNPSSAEAIDKAEKNLILEAERAFDMFALGWTQALRNVHTLMTNRKDAPEVRGLQLIPRDPRTPSKAAAADAGAKQLASVPWLAETKVGLELLGLSEQQIERALAEKRRLNGGSVIDKLRQMQSGTSGDDNGTAQPDDQPE